MFSAIIDAESAVEVCVADLLRRGMIAHGSSEEQADATLDGRLSGMQMRIIQLDKFTKAAGQGRRFENSEPWKLWNTKLARLRHHVVHRGVRQIEFQAANQADSSGIQATIHIEGMFSANRAAFPVGSGLRFARSGSDNAREANTIFLPNLASCVKRGWDCSAVRRTPINVLVSCAHTRGPEMSSGVKARGILMRLAIRTRSGVWRSARIQ
jgi:hypothetical protein